MKELDVILDSNLKNCTYQITKEYDAICFRCFLGCEKLKFIKIPDNIKTIKADAFWGCENLKTVKMTGSVKYIGEGAFSGCPTLEELYLSENVDLKNEWFDKETNPKCKVYHRGHVYTVEDILKGRNCMKTLNLIHDKNIINGTYQITEEYDKINDYCFYGCNQLKFIEISDNIKVIGENAFEACENLKTVKMTGSVKYIGEGAFTICPALEELYLSDNLELNGNWFNDLTNPNCKVYHSGHVYTVEDIRLYY